MTPQNILNADLHCHSVVSDGTMTPEALAERAKTNGVELWALTDHDEIGGQHRAAAAARSHGMHYLTGTEISVTFAGETVHIVGLGFDPDDAAMQQGLRNTRGGREQRAMEMSDSLAKAGIRGAFYCREYFCALCWRVQANVCNRVGNFFALRFLSHFFFSAPHRSSSRRS